MAPFRDMSRQLAPRSIRVIIAPTPSTFAERRSVLQVLQTYGKIDTFRRIGQRAHKYICVTNKEQTAKVLVHSSPIGCRVSIPKMDYDRRVRALVNNADFTLPKVDVNPQGMEGKVMVNVGDDKTQAGEDLRIIVGSNISQLLADAAAVEAAAAAAAMEEQPQAKEPKQQEQQQQQMDKSEQGDFEIREFELTIVPANDYDHCTVATRAIESIRWPINYIRDKSFVATTLSEMLPDNLLKEGLTYWHLNPILGGCRERATDRIARKGQLPGMIALEAAKMKEAKKKEQMEQIKGMRETKEMKEMKEKHKAMRGKDY